MKVNLFDVIATKELRDDLIKYQEIVKDKTYLEAWFAFEMIHSIRQELLTREENRDE